MATTYNYTLTPGPQTVTVAFTVKVDGVDTYSDSLHISSSNFASITENELKTMILNRYNAQSAINNNPNSLQPGQDLPLE